jgi:hypothetical protein
MTFASFRKETPLVNRKMEVHGERIQSIRNGYRGLGDKNGKVKAVNAMKREPPMYTPTPLNNLRPVPKITPVFAIRSI